MPRLAQPQPYEELDHTADAAVAVHGATPEETIARLVLALGSLVSGGACGEVTTWRSIIVPPGDRAQMAVDALRELLFVLDTERRFPVVAGVESFDESRPLEVTVGFAALDPVAHVEGSVLKAVTLHGARFEPAAAGWSATVVFDV